MTVATPVVICCTSSDEAVEVNAWPSVVPMMVVNTCRVLDVTSGVVKTVLWLIDFKAAEPDKVWILPVVSVEVIMGAGPGVVDVETLPDSVTVESLAGSLADPPDELELPPPKRPWDELLRGIGVWVGAAESTEELMGAGKAGKIPLVVAVSPADEVPGRGVGSCGEGVSDEPAEGELGGGGEDESPAEGNGEAGGDTCDET